jgi:stress response protein SCP2
MNTNLKRGEGHDFDHESCDLTHITIGIGWNVANKQGEIPPQHYPGTSKQHQEHDLDVVAVLLNEEGKVSALGGYGGYGAEPGSSISQGDVVFHKAPRHSSGAIWLTTDNRTGAGDNGVDNEQIIVKLDDIDKKIHRIVFFVVIHDGKHRGQDFNQISRAYIQAVDGQERLICRYDLSEDITLRGCTAVSFGQVVRRGDEWCFQALGIQHESDRFAELLKPYL